MKEKIKKINIILSLMNIVLLICAVLSIIMKNERLYALYWIIFAVVFIYTIYHVSFWSKVGLNLDKQESKIINNDFNNITAVTTIIIGLIYLVVQYCEMVNNSIKSNMWVIIITYSLLTVTLFFNYLAVYSANKKTKELVEKTFNHRKQK